MCSDDAASACICNLCLCNPQTILHRVTLVRDQPYQCVGGRTDASQVYPTARRFLTLDQFSLAHANAPLAPRLHTILFLHFRMELRK